MKRIKFALLTALLVASGAVLAHGGEEHAKKAGLVKKEQKDWGIAGDPKAVTRVIEITMLDTMRFSPDKIDAKQGETVKIVLKNQGQMLHEFVIGTPPVLDEHAALMIKFPTMEHDEPYMAHVPAGKVGEIIWTFNRPGDFDFACLIAGHYQAGMVGKIIVIGAKEAVAANAQDKTGEMKATQATQPGDMTDGEVRKVDKDNKKLTIKHGEIKNLDMPGMTMVFQVKDPAMLDQVKAGDKVKFTVEKVGSAFVVTDIQQNK